MKAKSPKITSSHISRIPKYVAAVTVAAHGLVALNHGGPVAVPDVSAYLSVAQWLHGSVLSENLAFHPGYGFLLAPFGGLSGSGLHTAALLLNAMLAGCCVVMAARLMERHGGPQWAVIAAAVAAALHPSLSASSRIAWPETTLVVVLLGLSLLIDRDKWTVAGAIAGLSIALHPRSVVIVIAVMLVAVAERRVRRLLWGVMPALVATGVLLQITDSWPGARLAAAQNLGGGPNPLTTLLGQWLTLATGTAGLAAIGLAIALRALWSRSWPPSGAFLALSALGMLILGGWVLAGSARIDTIMYGRYIGPWAVPLTVVGLAAVCRGAMNRRTMLWVLIPTAIAVVTTVAASSQVTGKPRQIMTLSLGSVWRMFDERLVWVALAGLAITLLAVTAAQRGPLTPAALFVLIAVSSTAVNHYHLHEVGQIADGQVTTAALVPDGIVCLAHDSSTKSYAMWLYRLQLPNIDHRRVDLTTGGLPCGPYVVAGSEALNDCPTAELVGIEPRANWGLWRYPRQACS